MREWCSAVGVVFLVLMAVAMVTAEGGNPLAKTCSLASNERRLYVSTVDGALTALDVRGRALWSYYLAEPLFSSSLSYSEASEAVPDLIPGLDRSMYHWDGHKLLRLPVSAEDLIDHTHPDGRGSALAGSKSREVVGLNLQNGHPVYECTHAKCHRYDNQSLIRRVDVLRMTGLRVTVREADEKTGEEMWNFTVGEVQLSLVEGGAGEMSCVVTDDPRDWGVKIDTVAGAVTAVDSDSHEELWKHKLSAPVVGVWLHEGSHLQRLDAPSPPSPCHSGDGEDCEGGEGGEPVELMLVHYNSQYYIQPVVHTAEPDVWRGVGGAEGEGFRVRGDQPVLDAVSFAQQYSLAGQSDPAHSSDATFALSLYYDEDSFEELCSAGPNGLAMYFYPDLASSRDGAVYQDCSSAEENGSGEGTATMATGPLNAAHLSEKSVGQRLLSFGFSVGKYFIFGAFILGLNKLHRYHKFQRRKHNSNSTSSERDEEDEEFAVLDKLFRHRTCALEKEAESESAPPGRGSTSRQGSTPSTVPTLTTLPSHSSSTDTITAERRLNSTESYSRFELDYELKGRLGKGGFGVVYHVQNTTDGREYAVKRIKLPNSKSAKEKVMREVHALAQLDHPKIVRYFHSWVERAPLDWSQQEEWAPLSRKESYACADQSPFPSTAFTAAESSCDHTPSSFGHAPPYIHTDTTASSTTGGDLAPSLSSSSLGHSELPPPFSAESRSSSFVIEFREDSQPQATAEGCFQRDFLFGRDDLSSDGYPLGSTEDRERRDSVSGLLPVEPPTYLFIQMQLCQKESLKDWLHSNISGRQRGTVMSYFRQILAAVLYVHEKGMMHRDLKPSNIFFSLDGSVKVGDFGLVTGSVFSGLQNSYLALKSLADPDHKQHTGNIGSAFYMSPEQMSGLKYDQKVDIFSLGVIFFELHFPFHTEMERAKVLEDLRKQKFPLNFKSQLPLEAEFVDWLISPVAKRRPSADEIEVSGQFKVLSQQMDPSSLIPKL